MSSGAILPHLFYIYSQLFRIVNRQLTKKIMRNIIAKLFSHCEKSIIHPKNNSAMMKSLLPIILVATLIGCHSKKAVTPTVTSQEDKYMKSEFHFDNCDDLKSFLKTIIVTNKEDTTIKKNYFRIPYIISPYDFTKDIFHEKCFVGISVEELDDIFGERAFMITRTGRVVTTPTGKYPDYYHLKITNFLLKSNNNILGLDIAINNNIVTGFKVVQASVESPPRGKTN